MFIRKKKYEELVSKLHTSDKILDAKILHIQAQNNAIHAQQKRIADLAQKIKEKDEDITALKEELNSAENNIVLLKKELSRKRYSELL